MSPFCCLLFFTR